MVQEGKKPLPRYDLCGMHMPVGRLIKHLQTTQCDRNMQMSWRRRDVEIAAKCKGVTFILTGGGRSGVF